MEYRVKAKSNYRVKSIAHDVEILIPVPNDLRNPIFKVSLFLLINKTPNGVVKYVPDKDCIVWNLKDFPGQTEFKLTLQFNVPTLRNCILYY